NLRFFGNPLHPVQFGPFRSAFWGPDLESYYHIVEGARTAERYWRQLLAAPTTLATVGLEAVAIPMLAAALGLAVLAHGRAVPRPSGWGDALGRRAVAAL